ncbi:uncharacterized protein LOC113352776 [Papaver somniferum]|uniref:uncharacterized protein LOC113352776 n=1 Tax=Papaver somniferum TaxID=3469 RepID=UPI000E703933|nr:uncharacterized protein LOC113352776 [Papaver somniferum]
MDSVAEMVVDGRLVCDVRRRLTTDEQLEWDLLCNALGPVHSLNEEEDEVDILGGFSVKKCYEAQVQEVEEDYNFHKYLWRKNIPSKGSFMLWDNFHDSLPTRSMLHHRRVEIEDVHCLFCKEHVETADHMFLHCKYAFEVWSYFINAFKISWVFPSNVKQLFEMWSFNVLHVRCKDVWWKMIYAVLWHLWKERSSRAFGGREMDVEELCLLIRQTIVIWLSELDVFKDCNVSQILFMSDTILHM